MSAPKIDDRTRAQNPVKGTGVAPLLYWLTVICGLAGLTVLRIDEPRHVVPIWFGSIVGIALGQVTALLRIRVWTTTAIAVLSSWIVGPAVYIALCELFGFGVDTETALFALIPAFVCGYASLSERGGLLAFWYPAMLWMLVILDGEAPGSFAPRAYVPMVVGLGVFFVAFLRARESRRVALWRSYATARLAVTAPPAVLRASPLSGIAQLAWTGLVGGGALLIAAWVAPNLWQKDRALHEKAAQVPPPVRYDVATSLPCCPETWQTEKVREYISLRNDRDVGRYRTECNYCPPAAPTEQTGPYASHWGCGVRSMDATTRYGYSDYSFPTDYVGYNLGYNTTGYTSQYGGAPDNNAPSYANYNGGYNGNYQVPVFPTPTPAYTYTPPVIYTPVIDPPAPIVPIAPVAPVKPPTHKPHAKAVPAPVLVESPPVMKPKVVAVTPPSPPKATEPAPAPIAHEITKPRSPAPDPGAPWGLLLPLFAGVVVVPLGSRFVRRRITLRHLARPFWRETIDQRISNHWQRMLVGLRDAGIQIRVGEQPQAFAKRVGIEGMEDCATILERTRHGVRVDADDLAKMDASTTAICRTARSRAGVAGRVAASVRWPLV